MLSYLLKRNISKSKAIKTYLQDVSSSMWILNTSAIVARHTVLSKHELLHAGVSCHLLSFITLHPLCYNMLSIQRTVVCCYHYN